MKKFIDLTLPIITGHWRYDNEISSHSDMEKGASSNVTFYSLRTHMFTHIDAQKHQKVDGISLDQYPLDLYIGRASFIEIKDLKPNEEIDATRLEEAFKASKCEQTDRLILKTCWGLQRDWKSKEFWDDAPYLSASAAEYLASLGPRLVGYDFPQDYQIRILGKIPRENIELPVHDKVLIESNIVQIEYLHYLWDVPVNNFDLYALPLKFGEGLMDGAQMRVVVSYEE